MFTVGYGFVFVGLHAVLCRPVAQCTVLSVQGYC